MTKKFVSIFFLLLSLITLPFAAFSDSPAQILDRFFGNHSISFIQIGPHQGKTKNDPIFDLVTKNNWRGILVEPIPYLFEKLKENYKDIKDLFFEQIAITDKNGIMDFYFVDEDKIQKSDYPWWVDQIGSLDINHIKKHFSNVPIKQISVNCVTFQDLIEKYQINQLDLLLVDAEGHDVTILNSINFDKIKPSVIIFEHTHAGNKYKQCMNYLYKNGYKLVEKVGMDTIVAQKQFLNSKG